MQINNRRDREGCIHRPCEKITLSTFPYAESATKTDSALSALTPNIFLKKVAATILPELIISSFDTAAKYAILTSG